MLKNKVIYVEDDKAMLDLVEVKLEGEGINVVKSTDRGKSLEIIENQEISCVISDYSMPQSDLDCFEFLSKVKEIDKSIPFIIFTGKGSEEIASKAVSLNVGGYIRKSEEDSFDKLIEKVQLNINRYNSVKFSSLTKQSPLNLLENIDEGILIMNNEWEVLYANDKSKNLFKKYLNKDIMSSKCKNCDFMSDNLISRLENGTEEQIREITYDDDFGKWVSLKIQLKGDRVILIFNVLEGYEDLTIYEKVIDNTTDIITILDESGLVEYQTPSISKFGYDQKELYGEYIFDKIHPEDRSEVVDIYRKLTENEGERETLRAEYRFEQKDGSYVWCESIGKNCNNIDTMGFVISTRVITERKETERKLKFKNERLSELVQVLRHDIPNHLTVINGGIYEIKEDYPEAAERIKNASGRIQSLVKDLKEIGKNKQLNKENYSIEKLISEISVDEEEVNLEVEEDLHVNLDVREAKKLFENVIWNSIQHNDKKVTITIGELENKKGFFIKDNGTGIEETEKVFNIGYTTRQGNSGRGLSFVKSMAEEHDWICSLKESEEGGVRFEFEI